MGIPGAAARCFRLSFFSPFFQYAVGEFQNGWFSARSSLSQREVRRDFLLGRGANVRNPPQPPFKKGGSKDSRRRGHISILLIILPIPLIAAAQDDTDSARAAMVETIRSIALVADVPGHPQIAPRVLAAMATVPRHAFVPEAERQRAYADRPLPIGHGQTISQPYIVALMTHLLDPQPGDRMFELGTGSGYQAAVLAELVDRVYSMEIVEPLGQRSAATLSAQGYDNVRSRVGDGYHGWPEVGPFDGIVVTAAGDHIPPPLVAQLAPGGRMVIPVGGRFMTQQLMLVEKHHDGSVTTRALLPVRFVPLTGEH